jgi:GTP-binding protein EngB required for normal cell division
MNLFEVIETIATKQNMVSVLKQLEEIRAACHEKDLFDLLILGQFKAGKSSFINQFLGSNLLPTGVLPVTAIVTRIRFGEKQKAVIHYFNHKKEEIAPARLWEFVTENENPENKKKVSVVDLYVPDIKHLNPLRLVDTPGIGSILNHNSLVTHSWLGKIKAAIVVISAVQPLSDNDVTLIREAMEQSPKVYILLSKTDLVTGQELDQIITFINNKLQKFLTAPSSFFLFPFKTNLISKKPFLTRYSFHSSIIPSRYRKRCVYINSDFWLKKPLAT